MAYEFLKKYFATEEGAEPKSMTFEELTQAMTDDKDLKIADLSTGAYVSKEKLDSKITELKGVRGQLDAANTEIQSYKDMDIEGIKTKASEWETKYNTETDRLNKELKAQARSHATDMFLGQYKYTSTPAKAGIRDAFEKKNFQLDEDGRFLGASDYMKSLMENDEYKGAFVTEKKEDEQGGQNPPPMFSAGSGNKSGAQGNGGANAFNAFGFTNLIRQPENNK